MITQRRGGAEKPKWGKVELAPPNTRGRDEFHLVPFQKSPHLCGFA